MSSRIILTKPDALWELMDNLLLESLLKRTKETCVKNCYACEINHGSQNQHQCIMREEDDYFRFYGVREMEQILSENLLEKAYKEAVKVMKLQEDPKAWQHYGHLKKDYLITLCYLDDVKDDVNKEYEKIRNYTYSALIKSFE